MLKMCSCDDLTWQPTAALKRFKRKEKKRKQVLLKGGMMRTSVIPKVIY